MVTTMILLFAVGYLCIATEHILHINKATFALILCGILWAILGSSGVIDSEQLSEGMLHSLGETAEIAFFLIGAMTIVELIDRYGGFSIITSEIHARNKRKLLWIIALTTFFLSAILDNMTSTIIMVMMMRRMLTEKRDRWLFASVIVMSANAGGAWSPIGDITTIMLWMKDYVTSTALISQLLIPSLISMIVPTWIASRFIKDEEVGNFNNLDQRTGYELAKHHPGISAFILISGVGLLLFVPIFKAITGMPPYMGILLSLGILWFMTEVIVHRYKLDGKIEGRISQIMTKIDLSTVLFFVGILMSVSALGTAGILTDLAAWLNATFSNVFAINTIIGSLSAIIDNVPLVAASMDMYPVISPEALLTSTNAAYDSLFTQDGLFWILQSFCAGVGGSMLIIGSAAGVVAMAIEKISFTWYLKHFSWMALVGYLVGIGTIALIQLIF